MKYNYYFVSFVYTTNVGPIFANTLLQIHPLRWLKDVNGIARKRGYTILSWQKISKLEYDLHFKGGD